MIQEYYQSTMELEDIISAISKRQRRKLTERMGSWTICFWLYENQLSRILRKLMFLIKQSNKRKRSILKSLTARRNITIKRRLPITLKCYSLNQIFRWRLHPFNKPTWRAEWSLIWKTSKKLRQGLKTMIWAQTRWLMLSWQQWPITPLDNKGKSNKC